MRRSLTAGIGMHLIFPRRENFKFLVLQKSTKAYTPIPSQLRNNQAPPNPLRPRTRPSPPILPILLFIPTNPHPPDPRPLLTPFFNHMKPPENAVFHPLGTATHYAIKGMLIALSRRADVGARTIVTAACAGKEADGEFMMDGQVREVVGWVLTEEGSRVQERVFREILGAAGVKEGDLL